MCRWAKGDDALPLPSPLGSPLYGDRHNGGLTAEGLIRPFISEAAQPPEVSCGRIRLRAASYNALSLATDRTGPCAEGLAFQPGRPALLAKQLQAARVDFAAIQEARTDEGFLVTEPFLRYCSGSVKGHFGVEVWFRRGHKICCSTDGEGQAVFEKSSFIVLDKDPRCIIVLFKCGGLQIIFASLHAPHRGASPAEINGWWAATEETLYRASRGCHMIIGIDANASVGTVCSECVSSIGAETQDLPGDCLHQFLHKCSLWAPATFDGVQSGQTWTFVQRRNGATTRPDYVLLPLEWREGKVYTWTDTSIVAANSVLDHVATVASLEVNVRTSIGKNKGEKANFAPRIDVKALVDPANHDKLSEVFRGAPRPDWDVTAHAHVACVTTYLQEALSREFPAARRKPLHPYLSADAWDMQQQVAWLRRKCAQVRGFIRRQTLLACFHAFRVGEPGANPRAGAGASRWLSDAQTAEALYGFRLGAFARALRARCKTDRAAYAAQLADEVQAGKQDAFQAVNKLVSRRRGKPFAPAVLPGIENTKGDICTTPEEALARWRDHFSALEDGVVVTRSELGNLAAPGDASSWPCPSSLISLPSPLDLRNAILVTKRGKASGPDGLPGELGLGCPEGLQALLFPLCLKLGLLGEEAIGHKSGSLTWLYKGKGPHTQCSSFRGILLLSYKGPPSGLPAMHSTAF